MKKRKKMKKILFTFSVVALVTAMVWQDKTLLLMSVIYCVGWYIISALETKK